MQYVLFLVYLKIEYGLVFNACLLWIIKKCLVNNDSFNGFSKLLYTSNTANHTVLLFVNLFLLNYDYA